MSSPINLTGKKKIQNLFGRSDDQLQRAQLAEKKSELGSSLPGKLIQQQPTKPDYSRFSISPKPSGTTTARKGAFNRGGQFSSLRSLIGSGDKKDLTPEEEKLLENIRKDLALLGLADKDSEDIISSITKKVKHLRGSLEQIDLNFNGAKLLSDLRDFETESPNIKTLSDFAKYLQEDENAYVQVLHEITDGWLLPFTIAIETNRGVIFYQKELTKVFGNIQILESLHSELLNSIKNLEDSSSLHTLFRAKVSAMSCYSTFRYNTAHSTHILNTFENTNKDFILHSQRRGVSLKRLLSVPNQRIATYKKVFQFYKNLVAAEKKDEVQTVIDMIEDVDKQCQKYVEETIKNDKIQRCKEIIQNYPPDETIDEPGRQLIREGDLYLSEGPKQSMYHVFLFNDLLVFTESTRKDTYKYKGHIDMTSATIQSRSQRFSTRKLNLSQINKKEQKKPKLFQKKVLQRSDQPSAATDIKNSIQVISPSNIYMFCASTLPEREMWLNDMIDVVDYYQSRRVFGVPLEELVQREEITKTQLHPHVPNILHICMEYLQQKEKITAEGIFRISASYMLLDAYKNEINRGNSVDLSGETPHTVSHLFKVYLRELPDPLLTFALYDDFCSCVEPPNYVKLKELIGQLPEVNRNLLKVLVKFFQQVTKHADKNKMTTHNLSLMIEPNVLKKKNVTLSSTININHLASVGVVEMMLNNPDKLFD